MKQSDRDSDAAPEKIGDHVTIRPRGKVWWAYYQLDGEQQRKSLKTSSKKQARTRAIRIDADLTSGRLTHETKAPSLQAVIDEYRKYLATERRAKATMDKYERAFTVFLAIADQLKIKNILGVNLRFVDAFRAQRVAGGAEPMTVHTDTVIVRQIVNFALRRDMISRDPLRGFQLKKPKPASQPCWSIQQVDQILQASHEPQCSQYTVLADTGMRVGELKHLTWADIDFDNGVIHIREKPGWKPKTGDVRVIPMTPRVRAILKSLARAGEWVFTAVASSRYPKGDHQVSERRLLDYLKRVLKKLGLPGHVHTFRHHFISSALMKGIPEAMVRKWVGHVDQQIMRRYTHVADKESKSAMARLAVAKTKDENQHKEEKS
jgi:integrase